MREWLRDFHLKARLYRWLLRLAPSRVTRDIRLIHQEVVAAGLASWLGEPIPVTPAVPLDDVARAVARVRALLARREARTSAPSAWTTEPALAEGPELTAARVQRGGHLASLAAMLAAAHRERSRMSDAALEVEGVSYGYTRAVKALDQVGFTVPRGEFTALLGPNGAGKTTLMALITHLFSAETGRIARLRP